MNEEKSKVDRVYEVVLKFGTPILFACVGWTANSIMNHETRLTVIESTYYSRDDAADHRLLMDAKITALKEEFPPPWLRQKIDEMAETGKQNTKLLNAIDRRLVAIERK